MFASEAEGVLECHRLFYSRFFLSSDGKFNVAVVRCKPFLKPAFLAHEWDLSFKSISDIQLHERVSNGFFVVHEYRFDGVLINSVVFWRSPEEEGLLLIGSLQIGSMRQ